MGQKWKQHGVMIIRNEYKIVGDKITNNKVRAWGKKCKHCGFKKVENGKDTYKINFKKRFLPKF